MAFDLADTKDLKSRCGDLYLLTKKSIQKDELEEYWMRFKALEPERLQEYLYTEDVIRILRKLVKRDVGKHFQDDDLIDSIYKIISRKHESIKPETALIRPRRKSKKS